MSTTATMPPIPQGGWAKERPLPTHAPEAETLLHFSEDPNIACFVPRPVKNNPDSEPLVWTIDEAHAPLYFFPRDCPRIAYWNLPTTTVEDRERFLGITAAKRVIAIEGAWLERLRRTELYAYRFASAGFVALQDHGCHVTRETVTPLSVEPLGDLLTRLQEASVELRITPSLWPLRKALLSTTLHFSMIRMRNAAPSPEGYTE
jgi:hypothetical protein